MSNHRITIIAALSAIALFASPVLTAQTSSTTAGQSQQPYTSSASSTTDASATDASTTRQSTGDDQSTSRPATSPATDTEAATSAPTRTSPTLSETTSQPTSTSSPSVGFSQTAGYTTGSEIKRADDMAEQSSAARLKGQRVRDPSGNELGKINDFVIDAASGQVAHVVISTGGVLGLGDKLRLIPGANLKQSASNEFSADMVQTDFEALPTISEKDLKAGRITAHSSTSAQTSAAATSQSTGQVIRASDLKDKSIRSDNSEVGEIESIVIDLQRGEAKALIDVNSGFAGEGGKFLVPFSKLEVRSSEADHIGSSLIRSDFAATAAGATSATLSSSTLGAQSASIETPASTSSSSQVTGASATSPSASTGTTSSSYPDSSTSTTAGRSDRSESTDLTDPTRSPSDATSAVSSADRSSSISTAAITPGTTSTYPAITGDQNRSPGLADTANTSSDSTSTGSSIVTATPPPVPADEQLTPTGRTSAEQSPASGATAMAIRQALDSDATLAHEDVQVTTKIVLHGSVKNEEAKSRIEELAKKAATNAEIDNQITVQNK